MKFRFALTQSTSKQNKVVQAFVHVAFLNFWLLNFEELSFVQCRGLYMFCVFHNAAVLAERILFISATLTWRKWKKTSCTILPLGPVPMIFQHCLGM